MNDENRSCPLHEALLEANHPISCVGASYISFKLPDTKGRMFFDIDPSTWNEEICRRAIRDANNGSMEEITVIFF